MKTYFIDGDNLSWKKFQAEKDESAILFFKEKCENRAPSWAILYTESADGRMVTIESFNKG